MTAVALRGKFGHRGTSRTGHVKEEAGIGAVLPPAEESRGCWKLGEPRRCQSFLGVSSGEWFCRHLDV